MNKIKAHALKTGIPLIGFCAPGLPDDGKRLDEWLEKGCEAGMAFMRKNVQVRKGEYPLLPGQKTVIICGFPYPCRDISRPIAPYGLLRDYHAVVGVRLAELETFIRALAPECRTRAFVDTLPVMERAYAGKAGLGAIGKNTMLINPGCGSSLFLGGIMTDLEIEPDFPDSRDICGSCRKCIEACPTGALSEYRLDARRCLSYHTIENRGDLPADIRQAMGKRAFGCGICEKVCPLNRPVVKEDPEWGFQREIAESGLDGLLEKAEKGFRRYFGKTPVCRTGRKRFMRNLRIAVGNEA